MLVSGQCYVFSRVGFIFLSDMTEVEQRYVIKVLNAKKFTLNGIITELALVYGEQAYAKKVVEYSVHQVKLGRTTMEDEVKLGRLPLDDNDGRILTCLIRAPYSIIRSIAQVLDVALATVHRRLLISLDMKSRYFRWVPHMLTLELRDQHASGSRALLHVLRQQEKIHFRDIITGDESQIFIDTASGSSWLSLDEKLPAHPQPTISADKCRLVVFWKMKSIVQVNELSNNARINAAYFRDEILTPISQKLQQHASGRRKPWTLVHLDNAKVHTATAVSIVMPDLRLKRTLQPLTVQIYVHRTSSFLVGSQ
jgi:hypothetical protein